MVAVGNVLLRTGGGGRRMRVRTAWNKTANYVLLLVVVGSGYLGSAVATPYIDDYQLKSYGRQWIATIQPDQEWAYEKGRRDFLRNAASLGIRLKEESCNAERVDENHGRVSCEYLNDIVFWGTAMRRTVRFKWTVVLKYRH
jgi:hypothetical protein